MATRGGKKPIRKTSNPFMATTSALVGMDLNQQIEYQAPTVSYSDSAANSNQNTKGVVDYMYQTTSTKVGEGVERGSSRLSQQMDKFTVEKEVQQKTSIGIKRVGVVAPRDTALRPEDFRVKYIDTSAISGARPEHPMYSTNSRAIGEEKSQVQVDIHRKGIPNHFTNSFNGLRYRDYGLNTALTKSKVCDLLEQ